MHVTEQPFMAPGAIWHAWAQILAQYQAYKLDPCELRSVPTARTKAAYV